MAVDESSIAVIPAPVVTLPAENVFNTRRDKFMRVIGTTATIKFNTNASVMMSGIALGDHNLVDGSTVRIRVYPDFNQTGAVQHDSTALVLDIDSTMGDLIPQNYYYPFDEVSVKSIQIDISAPSNTEIDGGRIMAGYVFEPKWNYEWGSKWQWVEDGDERIASNRYRVFSFDLNELENVENDRYEYEKMKVTKQGDLLICSQPSAIGLERLKNTAICKRVNNIARVRHRANANKHSDTFKEVF